MTVYLGGVYTIALRETVVNLLFVRNRLVSGTNPYFQSRFTWIDSLLRIMDTFTCVCRALPLSLIVDAGILS